MKNTLLALTMTALLSGAALAQPGIDQNQAIRDLNPPSAARTVDLVDQLPSRFTYAGFASIRQGQKLTVGAQGQVVSTLQQTLIDLGFGLPAGVDGEYGGQTHDAVAAFQSSRGLKPTGVFDAATLKSLEKTAPLPGKKIWEDRHSAGLAAAACPTFGAKKARVLVDLSEHRLTVYDGEGQIERVFPVASGAWGTPTDTGVKIVYDKVADPTPIAWALWPESRGGAFGTRLLDLSWHDPATGASWGSGEELHGTYVRNSIGSNASHGCVRMQNEDVEWVYQNVKVGDIVVIRD